MRDRFVLLSSVGDPNLAALLSARLEAEGIETRLRGEAFGPYRLVVGAMAETEIWVPQARLEEAALVMLAAEADSVVAEADDRIHPGPSRPISRSWWGWAIGVLLIALVVYARVVGF